MSRSELTSPSADSSVSKPAVGLVASDEVEVLRNLLGALEHNLPVILANTGEAETVVDIARRLGVQIVEPPEGVETIDELRDHFATVASGESVSGIIVPEDSSTPINFERSVAEFDPDERVSGTVSEKPTANSACWRRSPLTTRRRAIADVVTETKQYADLVLVIDDGSSDDTVLLAKEAGATVIEHEENGGYGAALRTAFREANRRRADHP